MGKAIRRSLVRSAARRSTNWSKLPRAASSWVLNVPPGWISHSLSLSFCSGASLPPLQLFLHVKWEFPAVPPVSAASLPSTGRLWEGSCSVFSTPSQQVTADSDKISPEPISALAEPASAPQPLLAGWVLQPHHLSGFPQTPSGLSTSVLYRVAQKGMQQPDPASQAEGNNHSRPPAACAFPGQHLEPHGVVSALSSLSRSLWTASCPRASRLVLTVRACVWKVGGGGNCVKAGW